MQKYFSSLMMNSTRLQVDKKTMPFNSSASRHWLSTCGWSSGATWSSPTSSMEACWKFNDRIWRCSAPMVHCKDARI